MAVGGGGTVGETRRVARIAPVKFIIVAKETTATMSGADGGNSGQFVNCPYGITTESGRMTISNTRADVND